MDSIKTFNGLNNKGDPLRLGLSWLVTADNVDITSSGALERRDGYAMHTEGVFTSAYNTLDFTRIYLVKDGSLVTADGVVLMAGLAPEPMHWCEVNQMVYFNNGTDDGVIRPDHEVLPWRNSLLEDLPFLGADGQALDTLLDPLPYDTDVIQHWRGRIYAAQYMASDNQTVLWFSQPLGYHLFSLDEDFIILPGRITMLAPHEQALVIGTDARIYAYDGERLSVLADYGVPPGQNWDTDGSRILFWTARGLCAALPFSNLTDKQVSVSPGIRVGGCLVQQKGQKRYITVLQQGGQPFNSFT